MQERCPTKEGDADFRVLLRQQPPGVFCTTPRGLHAFWVVQVRRAIRNPMAEVSIAEMLLPTAMTVPVIWGPWEDVEVVVE